MTIHKLAAVPAALLLFLLAIPSVAQRSSVVAGINNVHAPVPAPLVRGKRAFISYELGAVTAFPDNYSGGPERAYSEFYAQMSAWDGTSSSMIRKRPTSSSPSALSARRLSIRRYGWASPTRTASRCGASSRQSTLRSSKSIVTRPSRTPSNNW